MAISLLAPTQRNAMDTAQNLLTTAITRNAHPLALQYRTVSIVQAMDQSPQATTHTGFQATAIDFLGMRVHTQAHERSGYMGSLLLQAMPDYLPVPVSL